MLEVAPLVLVVNDALAGQLKGGLRLGCMHAHAFLQALFLKPANRQGSSI